MNANGSATDGQVAPGPASASHALDERLGSILEELASDGTVAADTLARGRERFPSYARVPANVIAASVERSKAVAIHTLRTGVVPQPEEVWAIEEALHERLALGLTVTEVLGGFREALKVIQSRVLAGAATHGLPAEHALRASTLLWDLGDVFTLRLSNAFRELEVQREVALQQEREQALRRLLEGELTLGESRLAEAHLAQTGPIVAVVTAPLATPSQFALPATLLREHGRAIGYLPAGEELPARIDYSVGPAVHWRQLPDSLAAAHQVRAAAELVDLAGRSDVARASWRIGIPAAPALASHLHEKYIAPVREHGEFGELVLHTIAVYLEHDMRVNDAARQIPVHPNTLRYRLQKFEEIAGASLGSFTTLVEVGWALAAAGVRA
ncbi:helix-turn-helix domain-containing protein [Leucobacter albus]|uniref:Helix-turn-helix domain-containing protein n=1 Tax=Leucobacter albus TaxID=272210 RepID=A0ABW3TJL0_9MICO